jgi:hypothetical protein
MKMQSELTRSLATRFGAPKNVISTQEIQEYKDIILAWVRRYPPIYDFYNPDVSRDDAHPWIYPHRFYLYTMACLLILNPIRHYMVKSYTWDSPPDEMQCRADGIYYSLILIKSLRKWVDRIDGRDGRMHFIIFSIFDTAAILCTALVKDTSDTIQDKPDILHAIAESVAMLKALMSISKTAKMSHDILYRLVKKLGKPGQVLKNGGLSDDRKKRAKITAKPVSRVSESSGKTNAAVQAQSKAPPANQETDPIPRAVGDHSNAVPMQSVPPAPVQPAPAASAAAHTQATPIQQQPQQYSHQHAQQHAQQLAQQHFHQQLHANHDVLQQAPQHAVKQSLPFQPAAPAMHEAMGHTNGMQSTAHNAHHSMHMNGLSQQSPYIYSQPMMQQPSPHAVAAHTGAPTSAGGHSISRSSPPAQLVSYSYAQAQPTGTRIFTGNTGPPTNGMPAIATVWDGQSAPITNTISYSIMGQTIPVNMVPQPQSLGVVQTEEQPVPELNLAKLTDAELGGLAPLWGWHSSNLFQQPGSEENGGGML